MRHRVVGSPDSYSLVPVMKNTHVAASACGALVGGALGAVWAVVPLLFDNVPASPSSRDVAVDLIGSGTWSIPRAACIGALVGSVSGIVVGVLEQRINGRWWRFLVIITAGALLGASIPFVCGGAPPQGR